MRRRRSAGQVMDTCASRGRFRPLSASPWFLVFVLWRGLEELRRLSSHLHSH